MALCQKGRHGGDGGTIERSLGPCPTMSDRITAAVERRRSSSRVRRRAARRGRRCAPSALRRSRAEKERVRLEVVGSDSLQGALGKLVGSGRK